MALLTRLCTLSNQLKSSTTLYNVSRCYAAKQPWDYLWQAGPEPKTEEERRKAAEKYGLHPYEYETYDLEKDGIALGDYPKLPRISTETKDPYEPWDMPYLRRNYHDPVHYDIELMGEDRFGYFGVRQRYSVPYMLGVLSAVVGTIVFLTWLVDDRPLFRPALVKQFPTPGEVHYTFEPAK